MNAASVESAKNGASLGFCIVQATSREIGEAVVKTIFEGGCVVGNARVVVVGRVA